VKGLTNNSVLRAHYDIIFKNVIRRSEINLMDIENFFDALEVLSDKLFYKEEEPFERFLALVSRIKMNL
jgi:hypothetical protein